MKAPDFSRAHESGECCGASKVSHLTLWIPSLSNEIFDNRGINVGATGPLDSGQGQSHARISQFSGR
jgi:hypothetical protein